jgi:hypothetical protein
MPSINDASQPTAPLHEDLLWGSKAIADEIGIPMRKALRLLEAGRLPAKKAGREWCSSRSALRQHFVISEAAA